MSKVYSDQIEKVHLLLAGLKKNLNLVKDKGLDEAFIKQLEADARVAEDFNNKNDELKAELKTNIRKVNVKLEDIKEQVKKAKKVIKLSFSQESWVGFGVHDKR